MNPSSDALPVSKGYNPRKSHPFSSSKFKRRCPSQYFYIPIECAFGRNCDDGLCPLSHTKLEVIFHPVLHRTRRCGMALLNVCVFSQRCAFFHNSKERVSSHLVWLMWQKHWALWEIEPDVLSQRFNLDVDASNKFYNMLQNRLQTQYILNNTISLADHSGDSITTASTHSFSNSSSFTPKSSSSFNTLNISDQNNHKIMKLEKHLNAILDSCNTPETTASTLTPDIKQYLKPASNSERDPFCLLNYDLDSFNTLDRLSNLQLQYK